MSLGIKPRVALMKQSPTHTPWLLEPIAKIVSNKFWSLCYQNWGYNIYGSIQLPLGTISLLKQYFLHDGKFNFSHLMIKQQGHG